MIPIFLNPAFARVAVIGRGPRALQRVLWLRQAGAAPDVWSDDIAESALSAGETLRTGLPSESELAAYHAIWIADLSRDETERLTALARARNLLVNVEDDPPFCDFHTPAVMRRGKLTIAVGTGGASPAVARAVRERLEVAFPEAWGEALEEIGEARTRLRARGESGEALASDARARLSRRGLV